MTAGVTFELRPGSDGPAWGVVFDPPRPVEPGTLTLLIGAQPIDLEVSQLYESERATHCQVLLLDTRTMAHLWAAVNQCPEGGADTPFVFRPGPEGAQASVGEVESGRITGTVDSARIRRLLQETEGSHPFGLRTHDLAVPVYMSEFWDTLARATTYRMMLHQTHFRLVSDELLAKASRLDAERNWAAVVPAALAKRDEVLEALRPLIEHRQGEVVDLPVAEPLFIDGVVLPDLANRRIDERPYYLALVGDFDVCPMDAQHLIQGFGAVGRLAFDTPQDYAAYADKVIAAERRAGPGAAPPVVAYVASDLDDVNSENGRSIVAPLRERFEGPFVGRGQATKRRVLELLESLPDGSIAFVSAHGFEHAAGQRTDRGADQRLFQGSLVLDDFVEDGVPGETTGMITPLDAARARVVRGGLVILHACYSAGTVAEDTVPPWVHLLAPPRAMPRQPFVSGLAKTLLANPEGPLAVFGHVNRSHRYEYFHPDAGDAVPATWTLYHDLLSAVLSGHPVGLGRERARTMTRQYVAQAETASHQVEMTRTGRCVHGGWGVWSGRKDPGRYENAFVQYSVAVGNFRNYAIVGDPMVRCVGRRG